MGNTKQCFHYLYVYDFYGKCTTEERIEGLENYFGGSKYEKI